MPKLPITVDLDFYDQFARATSEGFADSYLSGADLVDGRLLPRTLTAWDRISQSYPAREALRKAGVTLIKPPRFKPAPPTESPAA